MNKNSGRLIPAGLKSWTAALLLTVSGGLLADNPPTPLYPQYPSETPQKFTPVTESYDYNLRDVMIPMRDGVNYTP